LNKKLLKKYANTFYIKKKHFLIYLCWFVFFMAYLSLFNILFISYFLLFISLCNLNNLTLNNNCISCYSCFSFLLKFVNFKVYYLTMWSLFYISCFLPLAFFPLCDCFLLTIIFLVPSEVHQLLSRMIKNQIRGKKTRYKKITKNKKQETNAHCGIGFKYKSNINRDNYSKDWLPRLNANLRDSSLLSLAAFIRTHCTYLHMLFANDAYARRIADLPTKRQETDGQIDGKKERMTRLASDSYKSYNAALRTSW